MAFGVYLLTWLAPYAEKPRIWVAANRLPLTIAAVGGLVCSWVAGLRIRRNHAFTLRLRRWVPHMLTAIVVSLAAYAWFLRVPEGKLALHDAQSLRMFSWYVHPAAIAAALAGLAIVAPRVLLAGSVVLRSWPAARRFSSSIASASSPNTSG